MSGAVDVAGHAPGAVTAPREESGPVGPGHPVVDRLGSLLASWTGIDFARGGRATALRRLLELRVAELGLGSPDAYLERLRAPDQPEAVRFIEALTVNHTWFFRDPEQLEVVVELLRAAAGGRPVRVWVPGCATGEDVFSLALLLRAAGVEHEVVGSDISPGVLDQARSGVHSAWSVSHVPARFRDSFRPLGDGRCELAAPFRAGTRFARHNLMDPPLTPRAGGGWDAIVCRNVLIYMGAAQSLATLERLGTALAAGGWLHLGASEIVRRTPATLRLHPVGRRFALRPPGAGECDVHPPPAPAPFAPPVAVPAASTPVEGRRAAAATRHDGAMIVAAVDPSGSRSPPLREAAARFAAGDVTGARTAWAGVLADDPLCIEAHVLGGVAAYLDGDVETAVRELRGALFLDGRAWLAAFYLALCYELLGLAAEARREYRRVVETCTGEDGSERMQVGIDVDAWRAEVLALARVRGGGANGRSAREDPDSRR